VPAGVRLNQLHVNLKRLQTLSATAAGRYVNVNIPSAQVEAVQNGQVMQRHTAVVGKNDLQTPELTSKIVEINFNPYWYVPRSIVYNDLVPKGREFARRGQDILAAMLNVFSLGFLRKGEGKEAMYIWPYFAEIDLSKLTPAEEVELFRIVPPEQALEMKKTGKYTYYRAGIGGDGVWHYFLQ